MNLQSCDHTTDAGRFIRRTQAPLHKTDGKPLFLNQKLHETQDKSMRLMLNSS